MYTKAVSAAIIETAVKDWRKLIKTKAFIFDEKKYDKFCNFAEIREFFRSDWCDELLENCGYEISGKEILAKLEIELEEAKEEFEMKKKKKFKGEKVRKNDH